MRGLIQKLLLRKFLKLNGGIMSVRACALPLLVLALTARAPAQSIPADLAWMRGVVKVVREHAFARPTSVSLYNGAIDGLREELMVNELPKMRFAKIPKGCDERTTLAIFASDYRQIARRYPKLLAKRALIRGAVAGMMQSLHDPSADFWTPVQYRARQAEEHPRNPFSGIGILVSSNDEKTYFVQRVFPASPARRAGLQPQDIILAVDGIKTQEMDIEALTTKLRGRTGTSVVLTVGRGGVAAPLALSMVREPVRDRSVAAQMLDSRCGYIYLKDLNSFLANDLSEALADLNRDNVKGLILDLRGVRGGTEESVVALCSPFLPNDTPLGWLHTSPRSGRAIKSRGSVPSAVPLVLLINDNTMGPAEAAARALHDNHRAELVGASSRGQNDVQRCFPCPDGFMVRLTVGGFSPTSQRSDRGEVKPNLLVEMKDEAFQRDAQLEAAQVELARQVP